MKIIKITTQELIEKYHKPEFESFCKECKNYGSNYSCPPIDFDRKAFLEKFKYAYIIGEQIANGRCIEPKRLEILEKFLTLEKKYKNSYAVSSTSCGICKKCRRIDGEPCLFPEKARYTLDLFSIDATKLAGEVLGIKIEWNSDKITLLSMFLCNDEIDEY